jgi:hypothetical protein
MTFGEALKIHQQNQADDVTIKPATRHYWNQIFVALLKSWPGLADREIRRVTKTDCKEWARAFRKVASPTRYNNTLAECTMKRFPSPRCASTIQILRPSKSMAETQPKVQPAFVRRLTTISQCFVSIITQPPLGSVSCRQFVAHQSWQYQREPIGHVGARCTGWPRAKSLPM